MTRDSEATTATSTTPQAGTETSSDSATPPRSSHSRRNRFAGAPPLLLGATCGAVAAIMSSALDPEHGRQGARTIEWYRPPTLPVIWRDASDHIVQRLELLGVLGCSVIGVGACVLVVALPLYFSSRIVSHIRRGRPREQDCQQCGYRLLPDQERCPECASPRPDPPPVESPHERARRSRRRITIINATGVGLIAFMLTTMGISAIGVRTEWNDRTDFIREIGAAEAAGGTSLDRRARRAGINDVRFWMWRQDRGAMLR